MPTVSEKRSLEQALLVRLYSKGIRLSIEEKVLKISRLKGSKGSITEDERRLIADRLPTLRIMLEADRQYGRELIKDALDIVVDKHPVGQGCSTGETKKYMWKAHAALGQDLMHALWYWLDRYIEESLKIIEEFRRQKILEGTRN